MDDYPTPTPDEVSLAKEILLRSHKRYLETLERKHFDNSTEIEGIPIDFQGEDLRRARFDGANLGGAYFMGCSFREASLQRSDFQAAKLDECNMKTVRLKGAALPHHLRKQEERSR